ncbi:MAG: hypothetical protein SA339_06670 [Methanomassiliicoccus sp.]|nr:hypothetical protein [Methanomassiliicoccus sp.]
MNECADVIKKHVCPACGAEAVMRFRYNDENMEASCSRCGALVRWNSGKEMAGEFFSSPLEYEQQGLTP